LKLNEREEAVSEIAVRDAFENDLAMIHEVLLEAFHPYRIHYTKEAYDITVCSPQEMKRRLDDDRFKILVAEYGGQIVGTATMKIKEKGILYLSSMAVKPAVQGKGVGYHLLKAIEQRARKKRCSRIILECCEFLRLAIGLYIRVGYERTGNKRPYYGIEVFEMQKRLSA
jgi:N-acetylglutamate synthase-like GNAT family acetyltransferase